MQHHQKAERFLCRNWVVFSCAYLVAFCNLSAAQPASAAFTVDAAGQVSIAQALDKSAIDNLVAATHLAGCEMVGEVQVKNLDNGGIEYRRTLHHTEGSHRCLLIEQFTPTDRGMHWKIEIQGKEAPWTTAIETQLKWRKTEGLSWWTAWGDSRPDAPEGAWSWTDPLVPTRFQNASLSYGIRHLTQPAISLPLVTVLAPEMDRGISLVLSPEDLLFDMKLTVTETGEMVFARTQHRITPDHPIRFAMDLITHEADWRAGLGWMVKRYPQYFDPPNSKAHEMAGCGAYSSHSTDVDAERLMRMAFRINWKASFDFPYMGMFIPPVPDDETEWTDFKKKATSIRRLREDIHAFTSQGFHVLNYFNVTEFGAFIKYPPPPRKAQEDVDLWKDPNDFLYYVLDGAILPKNESGEPIYSWKSCVVMDPGDPVYQQFLLDQAKRHIEAFPESSGICIDRIDWLQYFNPRFDDGLSWVDGKPARSLVVSWHEIMSKLGPMMHTNDKVIFRNSQYGRLDLMRHIDGMYDELGQIGDRQMGHSLNLCALLCVRKPVMEWTRSIPEIKNDPDNYFQRHLHMGAFLTAPVPGNDHTILPSANVDQAYYDYGPMLDALRGKRWVLEPHTIAVTDDVAKANLFEVPGGYVVPVTFGGSREQVRVVLQHLQKQPGQEAFGVEVIHPGETNWAPLKVGDKDGVVTLDVPLKRGCAMVKLSTSWIAPAATYFTTSTAVELGTVTDNAAIHYTLDGSTPALNTPRYTSPIRLGETTPVRMAVFVGNTQIGDTLTANYVKIPISAPLITPNGGRIEAPITVELAPAHPGEGLSVHYTLDGMEPTADAPRYTSPIRLTDDTTIKARTLAPDAPPGKIASANFRRLPPLPPNPDIFISDLKPVVSTVESFETAKVDRSTENKPMRVAGKRYKKGMGVIADSELAYLFKPEYKVFVAVVGIDDEMIHFLPASVTFQVLADDRLLEETPIMRPGQYWHLNVTLPDDTQRVRLIVTHAGDGVKYDGSINGDHGDWANAGFVTQ